MTEWQTSKLFKDKFKVFGTWNLKTKTNFPKCKILACDTETKLFRGGKLMNQEDVYKFYKECTNKTKSRKYNLNYFRSEIYVYCYCISISDGINTAIFQNLDDFITCVTMMRTKFCVWYNAKFDFTLFDYHFLINDWHDKSDKEKDDPILDNTFESLNGDFGQRYQMKIWKKYTNNSRHEKLHKTTFIDLCNVLSGGLKKNLEAFNIVDENNNPIRKLEMKYDIADLDNDNDLQYIINDTKGLYYLTKTFDDVCSELTGLSFLKGDYITVGGLSKQVMLKFMFKCQHKQNNVKAYKYYMPMTIEQDLNLRQQYLYKGGLCIINPDYVQKTVHNIYKYDINSMYPDKMRNSKIPFGQPKIYDPENLDKYKNSCCYVLKLKYLNGELKKNAIPIYMDCLTNDFVSHINEFDGRLIWLEELEMYEMYYELDYEIEYIYEFKGVYSKGLREFIDKYYDIKATTKNKSLKAVVKLILNSSYGKLSQRINNTKIQYGLDEEFRFLKTFKTTLSYDDCTDSSLLSIFHGSRITALARVNLGHEIMKICKNNPRKYFVYCDTDSVHALIEYNDTDNVKLGKMKFEGSYQNAIYLAPKTYLLNNDNDYEVHSKGVNTDVVLEVIKRKIRQGKTFNDIITQTFTKNVKFTCLNALNVRGGRALFYVDKCLMTDEEESEMLNLTHQDTRNLI